MDFKKNYYTTLGIPKDSTEKDIKKTYYKLSFTHHPDKGGDALVFAEITEAYNVLSENREEYDKIYEITKCDDVPIVKVGKNLLLPNTSFKSIDECCEIIKRMLNE